jgi:ankyrin repeat protein
LEESKAEHTPLSEDRPYVPLSVYQSSDIAANSTGRALLARAVETNRRDVVQFLLSRGLDVNDDYMRLLHSSVWAGQWFATVLLLDCGADVDVRATDRRRTPLMRAADRTRSVRAEVMPAHLAMVRLLLSRGADVRAKDRMGHQAHQIAAMGTPVRALLSDVRAAGGWRSYVHRDRMRLLVLRALCEKGRASTSDGLLARLFAAEEVASPQPSSEADDDALVVDRTVFAGNLPVRRSDVTAKLLSDAPARDDPTVDATARLLSDLDACMQFEEAYYEGDAADDDAKIISAAPAPAAACLDQDVFKKIFSFWEPLGHDMWLDLSRDSVQLDRYCRTAQVFKRMLIPHHECE